MGQRHQVYFRLPKVFYFDGNCTNRPERNIGFHNQWSYGTLPIRNALRIFDYLRKAGREAGRADSPAWSMPYQVGGDLIYVQSFDAVEGNVSRYYPLGKPESNYGDDLERGNDAESDCLRDPRKADNNDGITVIDLCPVAKGKPPTYCFVSVCGLECGDGKPVEDGKPMSATEYMALYYPKGGDRPAPKDIGALVNAMADFAVITPARLRNIFPAWLKAPKAAK